MSPPSETAADQPIPGGLEIKTSNASDGFVVKLTGELDLASAPSLERALQEAEAVRPARIVIDLHDLQFMDSTGLRTLLLARERAQESSRELTLRQGPHQVQRVFELSGTAASFQFED